ncbi:hypothetical protein [Erwinia pyrifoliae]|uniref:Uncharacterized protein n=1 Tax=Erwinia pyrifoliae TaxID=79967 RepID=A0ABY5X659_ERWPY|nr:hypothetical protein [Erwinia pyrifoliae]MCT2387755.1 hypothetical protein [Erwinia pyrifoliae]MCU8586011.1 hypothetical protein [Erwinia pyrifoliae]UWS28700.1 hypothetical protein NYP81_12185 [Erwinia pyrifoliae]UWS32841.1 hypothetical protein NYP84_14650 [Erwinia pyrifoliae]UXK11691.1 hypothetical protein NYP80_15500 [Erwinia pyrifoliae]
MLKISALDDNTRARPCKLRRLGKQGGGICRTDSRFLWYAAAKVGHRWQ